MPADAPEEPDRSDRSAEDGPAGEGSTVVGIGNLSVDRLEGDGFDEPGTPGGSPLYAGLAAGIHADGADIVASVCRDYPVDDVRWMAPDAVGLDVVEVLGSQRRCHIEYDADLEGTDRITHGHSDEEWVELGDVQAPRHVPEREDPDVVHLSPTFPRYARLYADWADEADALLSMDTSGYYAEHHRDDLVGMLPDVDLFLPSDAEMDLLFPDWEPEPNSLAAVAERGPDVVVVRLGAEGCVAYDDRDGSAYRFPAIDADVLDPTGAGDSFNGGFVSAFPEAGLVESCRRGIATATLCIQGVGADGLAETTPETVAELMDAVEVERID